MSNTNFYSEKFNRRRNDERYHRKESRTQNSPGRDWREKERDEESYLKRRVRSRSRSPYFAGEKTFRNKRSSSPNSSLSHRTNKNVDKSSPKYDKQKKPIGNHLRQTGNRQKLFSEKQASNTLLVSELAPEINVSNIEEVFRKKCLEFQTSMPDNFKLIDSLHMAYVIFPSVAAATKVLEQLGGVTYLNGNYYRVEFTPDLNQVSNKTGMTYVQNVNDKTSAYTTSLETTVLEDWICEFCDWKNFSKRVACYRCSRPKTTNCRIVPVIKQKTTITGEDGQIPPSSSLMIRGSAIRDSSESELLEVFSQFAHVKDIRMIRDKISLEPKYFAFVEFYSTEDATRVVEEARRDPIRLRTGPIFITFSKIKRSEEAKNEVTFTGNAFLARDPQLEQANQPTFTPISTSDPSSLQIEEMRLFPHVQINAELNSCQGQLSNLKAKDPSGEINIRREPSERERVEQEMKRWQKGQWKNDKKKMQVSLTTAAEGMTNSAKSYELANDSEFEKVITLGVTQAPLTTRTPEVAPLSEPGAICHVCSRKFPSEEKLRRHEELSKLHKVKDI